MKAAAQLMRWICVHNGAALLRRVGNPEALEEAARSLEAAVPDTPEMREAAGRARRLALRAQVNLHILQGEGFDFDFERGEILLPSRGKRGAREKVVSLMIASAFDLLDPEEWYSADTVEHIRRKLAELIVEWDPLDLSDTRIRGVVERHVTRRR